MGLRGPRRKPAEIDRIDGNPGRRRHTPPAVEAGGEPFVVEHLDDDAKACVELIVRMMPPRLYAKIDSLELAVFATAWSLHKRAAEALKVEPHVVPGSTGNLQPSPWIKILNEQARIMASLGDRLGLDPKSRAALNPPPAKPKSKFDGLIGQTRSSPSLSA